ncbi:MAG: ABC transporter permease [Elusimicrobia bacterium]|nr:ABC transporter permease [Elusimicrobiota bacterium]
MSLILLKGFFRKELTQALRDKRMRMLIFALPAIQLTIFGFALKTEVRNVRLSVMGRPGDALLEKVARRCYASGYFIPARIGGDWLSALRSGQAEAILAGPVAGLLADRLGKDKAPLQLLLDASNMQRAQQLENYVAQIAAEELAAYSGQPQAPPQKISVRVLYNPALDSAIFMVPAVMCMLLCVITIILTAMALAREKETGTFETIISAPLRNSEVLAGKTLPYVLLGLLDVPIILGVAELMFHVPLRGPLWELLLAAAVFVFATVAIGTVISTIAANQQQAMMASFLFPAILLSGIMFPIENMPEMFKPLAYLNPLKYFVTLLRGIMLKGMGPQSFLFNIACMGALCAGAVGLAALRFRQKLN